MESMIIHVCKNKQNLNADHAINYESDFLFVCNP